MSWPRTSLTPGFWSHTHCYLCDCGLVIWVQVSHTQGKRSSQYPSHGCEISMGQYVLSTQKREALYTFLLPLFSLQLSCVSHLSPLITLWVDTVAIHPQHNEEAMSWESGKLESTFLGLWELIAEFFWKFPVDWQHVDYLKAVEVLTDALEMNRYDIPLNHLLNFQTQRPVGLYI